MGARLRGGELLLGRRGTRGLGTLAGAIREKALLRDPGFVAAVWITAALKVLAAALALALVREWGRPVVDRLLTGAGWATGAGLTLYGGLATANSGLAEIGAVHPVDLRAAHWYLLLWGPVWLTGGVLFLGASWQHRRRRREAQAALRRSATGVTEGRSSRS